MEDLEDEDSQRRKVAVIAVTNAAAVTVLATTYALLDIPRKPSVNKDAERREYMESILFNDDKSRAYLRMGSNAFHHLCALIREKGLLKDTKNCQVEELLMRFLYLIGHNVRHRVLEAQFYRSRETISRQFNETLSAVLRLYKCLVANHAETIYLGGTQSEIGNDLRFSSYFKDCVGALDGTDIIATVPEEEKERFMGRKDRPTQNMMAACSFDLKFTYIIAGWEGSADDQEVLDDALARSSPFVVPARKYYLVDADYDHEPGFLAPYDNTGYHINKQRGRIPESKEELFNERHANLRRAIEIAFGVVKKRWPMLSNESFYSYKTQVKIAMACCVLHNHIIEVDPRDPLIEEVDQELQASSEDLVEEPTAYVHNQWTLTPEQARWFQFRDDMAQQMFNEYKHGE